MRVSATKQVLFKRLRPTVLFEDISPLRNVSVQSWQGDSIEFLANTTSFLYVYDGPATLKLKKSGDSFFSASLAAGMYASVIDEGSISGGTGLIISVHDYKGLFQLGGPIEAKGRLRYIDGCSDSLLLPPIIRGDPCFNHLHFPTNIEQSFHNHPTTRAGLVCRGRGECESIVEGETYRQSLEPGLAFVIPPGVEHRFRTRDQALDVVAFHPDSDTGPDHDDHPMVNRTYVEGVSATQLNHIRTQDIH
ncbi:MAG: cupin domain-containing protein [Planctomycetota bacterium]|nr:cupin domain-containing protein [Planctomycetota bacterium]